MFVLLQFPVTCVSSAPMSCPHDYRWHSRKDASDNRAAYKDGVWKETEELVVDRLHDRDRLSLRVVEKLNKGRAWRWWRPAKFNEPAGFERQQP